MNVAVASQLAGQMDGWTSGGESKIYDANTIFELINGEADIYFEYGFKNCEVRAYQNDSLKGSVEISIYDMGKPLHAFGLFRNMFDAQSVDEAIGAEAKFSTRQVRFWKGQYFVSAVDRSDAALPKMVLIGVASKTAASIKDKPDKPPELARLPQKNRLQGSERYAHESFLSRSFLKRTVFASYGDSSSPCTLFVCVLGNKEKAQQAIQRAEKVFQLKPSDPVQGLIAFRGTRMLLVQSGSRLTGVMGKCGRATRKSLAEQSLALQN